MCYVIFSEPTCAVLTLENGGVFTTNEAGGVVSEGGVATLFCNFGYVRVGDSMRTCTGGMWTGTQPFCQCKFTSFC